jgi:hypothetical protein
LDRLGVPMGEHGVPIYDPETLRVGSTSVYMPATPPAASPTCSGPRRRGASPASTPRIAASALAGAYAHGHRLQRAQHRRVGMPWRDFDERRMAVAQQRFGPVGGR